MCFSAEISFGAAVVLGAVGAASLKKVNQPKQIIFAAIPFVFSVQQACEGVLWLSLSHSSMIGWQRFFTYLFLFFAQMLWSSWIPLSFYLLENKGRAKKMLAITVMAGIADSLLLGYRLVAYGANAAINCSHIYYDIVSPPWMVTLSSLLYVVAIIFPPFVSGLKRSHLLGVLLAGSLILTKLFYEEYLISVWCFFAALLSIMIAYMMRQFHERRLHHPIENSLRDLGHQR